MPRLIIEYGDYECPYSRQAFRAIEQGLDAGQGPAGRRDGQLLAGDLE
jgi:hypothetical protein